MTYRHRIDLLLAGFFLLIALLAIIGVQDLPSDDQLFPITAGTLLLVATCIYAFRVLTRRHVDESSETPTILDLPSHEKVTILKMIIYISSLVLGVMLFGHLVTVPLFVFIYMLAHGENWVTAFVGGCVMLIFVRGILIELMNVAMPHPLFGNYLPF